MCRAFYLAADVQPQLISWNEEKPGFYVMPIEPRYESVRRHFSKGSVVYLGSHTGCGCGFSEELEPDPAVQESVRALRRYLLELVTAQEEAEVFACWGGSEALEPAETIVVSPLELSEEYLADVEPPWFARLVRPVV